MCSWGNGWRAGKGFLLPGRAEWVALDGGMRYKVGMAGDSVTTTQSDYVVLARKYRSRTFAELIGQEALVRTLTNAIAMNKIHHAYVLTGIRGTGKTSTARLLAMALNCDNGPSVTVGRERYAGGGHPHRPPRGRAGI